MLDERSFRIEADHKSGKMSKLVLLFLVILAVVLMQSGVEACETLFGGDKQGGPSSVRSSVNFSEPLPHILSVGPVALPKEHPCGARCADA
ncbi:hypothetical protein MSG28_014274 [Choristoneura fumiferana]|uniref:Uncharacterized protein n=1 Tax=Choristoneura fumiferana TaxID=7141 RepID=A0ACC0JGH9_CHOFU|nr:hypothetical protein MSG28_014274 [Choristoneura fumiferana]